jgi:hypothetical protein
MHAQKQTKLSSPTSFGSYSSSQAPLLTVTSVRVIGHSTAHVAGALPCTIFSK